MALISRNSLFVSLFVAAAAFCSCGGNNVKTPSGATATEGPSTNFTNLDTPVYFSGLWVNENYIGNVKQNKSPKAAQATAGEMKSCINIPLKTLVPTSFIFGFHEGGDPLVVVKNGPDFQLWDQQSKQPELTIKLESPERMKIGNDVFVKMATPGNSAAQDLGILSSVLFRGNYITSNGTTVEFTENGEVKGLDGYTSYSPIIDYNDVALDVDQLIMEGPGKPAEHFGFKFVNDALLVYQLKCVQKDTAKNTCLKVDFGESRYILKRK